MTPKKTIAVDAPEAFINRELSWLSFALRVLAQAEDPATPLLERIKFAGIMGMLYDEFAMKRIGGLRRRIEQKNNRITADGHTPDEELELCRKELHKQSGRDAQLLAAARVGNGVAQHLSLAQLLAAALGAHLLAAGADAALGIHHPVLPHQQLLGGAGLGRNP